MTMRVLLVEDDPDHAHLVRRRVERLPPPPRVEVIWATDLSGARARLEAETFELVVIDLRVQGQDGLQILEMEGVAVPRAVVLSSSDHPEDRARASAAGAVDYLVKPSGPSGYKEIARSLAEHLS